MTLGYRPVSLDKGLKAQYLGCTAGRLDVIVKDTALHTAEGCAHNWRTVYSCVIDDRSLSLVRNMALQQEQR